VTQIGRTEVNKAQLIDALAEKIGDKRTAGAAVDGIVDVIIRAVNTGERVNITGFGVFEKRDRAPRMARNPRTGEAVPVKKTTVPTFRPGTTFRDVVSGARKLPKAGATGSSTAAGRKATHAAATAGNPSTTTASTTKGSAAAKPSGAKTSATKAAGSKTAAGKASTKPTSKTGTTRMAKTARPTKGK
jgi:DNA-binding protein HU-beta